MQCHSFERFENASHRMGNLIDDLLKYSHVGQLPHEMEAVDLSETVRQVLEDPELDINETNVVINVSPLPVVQGYKRQLQQLFQDLIGNAVKYSKETEPPRIEILATLSVENEKRFHVVKEKDNGIGFDEAYREAIFQMFTRLHGKSEYSGTGVGLSIAKKVAEDHRGFIDSFSRTGEGSTFPVYLAFTQFA